MSDLFQQIYGDNAPFHKVCRVAYTLGNSQPVLCTHIGDQPLFYLEYEDDVMEDEDDDLFFGGNALIERELDMLRGEIAALEREVGDFESRTQRLAEFTENTASLFMNGGHVPARSRVREIYDVLEKSRTAAAYVERANEFKVEMVISAQVERSFYDRRSGKIFINDAMSLEDQVLSAVRELRRHWQHREGALINPLTFQPEHAVLVNRMQQADLIVSVIRVAWELQLAGCANFWERIEDSPMADLGRAYAREAFMDFRTINNGIASAAVLESWFLSERCRQYDRKIIQAMLADYRGYVFESAEASKSITAELIAALGSVPFGKNYLAIHAATIMSDPIFMDVRDRSNANFLWFIKFERSFKETEQELQKGKDLSTHDIRHEVFNRNVESRSHDALHTAEIIPLFGSGQQPEARHGGKILSKSKSKSGKHAGRSAQIIDLRAWSSSK